MARLYPQFCASRLVIGKPRTARTTSSLLRLLAAFYAYERPELTEFKAASAKFRADLPQVLEALRMAIGEAEARSSQFAGALTDFLKHAKEAINPSVDSDDVREMLIQHILTEEIFASVFDNAQYHRENNIARKLGDLEAKFFTGALRHATTELLRPYYGAIRHSASGLADRREKQTFLKKLYEDFYKVYNPDAADRLGVVYTPGEIVRFMIRGAEWLTEKHFGKTLDDEGVEILDPATGTGTFIVELLEHMQGAGRDRLRAKYKEELHANEVAILPYYVANLNIEATFASLDGQYAEFPGLVFVDTLDNTAGLGIYKGSHYGDLLGSIADENLERVKRQNAAKISVIIGNPPYNAWQSDYNARNPNRPYRRVDERISDTYRRLSKAQNTSSLSDMYVRFWRWASDRLKDDGVIAFVTNRSFIEKIAFDGFRLSIAQEFAECWLMDLGGDVRANPKLSGTKHNAMGIQTGLSIAFMIRKKAAKGFKLFYARRPEDETAREKLAFLESVNDFERWQVAPLKPDPKGNWLSGNHPDWAEFLPLADPAKGPGDAHGAKVEAIFRLSSNGAETRRDDWLWDRDKKSLIIKARALIDEYEANRKARKQGEVVKWDTELDKCFKQNLPINFDSAKITPASYRAFSKEWLYFDTRLNGRTFRLAHLYKPGERNAGLVISDKGWRSSFATLATDGPADGHMIAAVDRYFVVTRYRYISNGERVDNITDWGLKQFRKRYADPAITKDDIFAYCYAALHDPAFRVAHAADLRREFPRVPLNDHFTQWRDWGHALLKLHIEYEKAKPFKLTRIDTPGKFEPVAKLRSLADQGTVVVDSETQLSGIPPGAWTYHLGNRSAIDWVLDQHKEKTPRDPTIRAKFNTYRFADYKEEMIKLLAKVVTVSLETVKITEAMRSLDRSASLNTAPE